MMLRYGQATNHQDTRVLHLTQMILVLKTRPIMYWLVKKVVKWKQKSTVHKRKITNALITEPWLVCWWAVSMHAVIVTWQNHINLHKFGHKLPVFPLNTATSRKVGKLSMTSHSSLTALPPHSAITLTKLPPNLCTHTTTHTMTVQQLDDKVTHIIRVKT